MSAPAQQASPLTRDQIWEQLVVHHEWGHLAGCFEYDIPFVHVQMEFSWLFDNLTGAHVRCTDREDSKHPREYAIMCFAGCRAEARWLELHPEVSWGYDETPSSIDIADARALIRDADLSEGEIRRAADALVAKRWAQITHGAGLLVQARKMKRSEILRAKRAAS